MKQVLRMILEIRPTKWGAIGLILVITGWTLGLNPTSALAELSTSSFDQGFIMSESPIATPEATPSPTNTSTPTKIPMPTNTPPPAGTPMSTSTPEPPNTAQPTPDAITLAFEGPGEVSPGEPFNVTVEARGVETPGLYGVQFEVNFDPTLFSVGNLQVNADLSVIIIRNANNTSGKIQLAAARQGAAPGLTGDVPLLTFTVTAANMPGSGLFTITGQKIGSPNAISLNTTTQPYLVSIQGTSTPEPTPIPTETPTPGPTETPIPTDTPTPDPTETPQPGTATVSGQIITTGRVNNDWSGASATIDDSKQSATTDVLGHFSLANVTTGAHTSITADAPGYLPAVCTAPIITAPETTLSNIALLSGDVNDDALVNITDATTIGVFFGNTGPDLSADINRDQQVDILDLILVTINFGQGPQVWSCLE